MGKNEAVPTPANDGQPGGLLIVISGPSAAGKTTVGCELATRRERAIHIDGDVIQRLVVSGSVTMEIPPPPGALDQLRLRFAAALAVADLYRAAGFDAILSDNLFGEEARRFIVSALESDPSWPLHFVMLDPSIEAIRERYRRRPGGGYSNTLTPEVLKDAVESTPRVGLRLDTTGQTVTQTVDEVLARLAEAVVDPASLRAAG
ncbi:AAA family ATPase [Microlunatus parietis]|uniref:Putative kinase n=1 Tax=Microlunatus parietis TaxID=682979 RepID=A0A7Y9IEN8_9ACTN|nr:AAA family ATPase [Microlunatus parietis]NYE75385.1 putative kinase [Microlunatus parietis]